MDEQSTPVRVDRQSLYTDLSHLIRGSGLLRRRYAYYWSRITAAIAAFVLLWVGVVALGDSWFQLTLAVALGILDDAVRLPRARCRAPAGLPVRLHGTTGPHVFSAAPSQG